LTAFPSKILDNVSRIWSGAGIAASSRRGIKFQTCTNILNNFLTIPGIFGSPPTYFVNLYMFQSNQDDSHQKKDNKCQLLYTYGLPPDDGHRYEKRTPKRVLEWKPLGRRIRGRPKKRWIEDVEEDDTDDGNKRVEKVM
jgi:hypothetical protein